MRVLLPGAAILLAFTAPWPQTVAADTIVLKNGRRIVAEQVSEEETRVSYETSAGKLSLPKSMVDHVERDGARPLPSSGGTSGSNSPSKDDTHRLPPVPALMIQTHPDNVIVNDAVNRKFLDELVRQRAAKDLIVAAFLTAVEFEVAHGHLDSALDLARQCTAAASGDPRPLMGQAIVYFQRQEYRPARDVLLRAKVLAPESAEVWKLLGFAEYSSDRVPEAVTSWKKSLSIAPDAELEKMLERAERESAAEDRFLEANSNHFTLRFEGGKVSPTFRRDILDALESLYRALQSDLAGPAESLPDSITVILYPGQAFYDVTQAPTWTGALFDGKVRVPVEGLSAVTPQLRSVLKHELTHSFVRARSRARCPAWLNEGLAQIEEGKSIAGPARSLEQALRAHPFPLSSLSEPFSRMGVQAAQAAYAISLGATEMLRDRHGMGAIGAVLDRLAAGSGVDQAMRDEFGYPLDEADNRLLDYLKKK